MSDKKKWSAWRPVAVGFIGIAVLFGGFGTWSVMSNIAGAIIASGRIEVDRNRQVVQHDTGGTIAEIHVDEGDLVKAGDLLFQLDPQQAQSELNLIEGQLYELMARRGRLEAQRDELESVVFDAELIAVAAVHADAQELMDGQSNLFDARRDSIARETEQLEKQRNQIEDQISGITAQETSLAQQLKLIEQQLDGQQKLLDQGLAQVASVLGLQRETARLTGEIGRLVASRAEAEGRITELEIVKLKLGTSGREEAISQLREIRFQELAIIEQRRALLATIDRLDIRAPVSGIVYSLQVTTPRSVIRGAEPLMFLIPQDRPLVIAAQVMPTNIDEVSVGQEVNLRLSSLDQRTTPELKGRVEVISADALDDQNTGISYFRAEITLSPGEIERLPEGTQLLPGMPVDAFIKTGDRSPLTYLVKPVAAYFVKSWRES
ncbi:HlyD family type I secretion periplasmic adaptor subunit [Sulfitobacter donghicola]|uniref:Membrane fusion protein (MFP) family protein n=1 Tax=Sulfitobacter donghicola DSW-25 = KCTC 12864 = JCM 14565 TaxID=1300350 RepID=A0A073IMN4_9RHOB|nr:HlyD family type I secretion periplasmic adaptor subunit [Sulfitobacter donghicola]KEJ90850.1 RTX toxin [Sulfitobacter donghicola DSW-25 = KCTC 12864 = JCM 14565]KIN68128.1 Type I secretion membrane fusion protein, HlyD family [Sulfitobacter donghicola DSW-25 = KCTC 12864 = JCM 14565]